MLRHCTQQPGNLFLINTSLTQAYKQVTDKFRSQHNYQYYLPTHRTRHQLYTTSSPGSQVVGRKVPTARNEATVVHYTSDGREVMNTHHCEQ